MKRFKIIILILICLYLTNVLKAQEKTETKPLELPNYVIEGKGQINVQSGIKQAPGTINKLTKSELDSINSLQKEQTVLLPPKPLPENIFSVSRKQGFFKGSMGSYLTPDLEGGYDFSINSYKLYANAKVETSSGDARNSDYLRIYGGLNSEYLAPDKFFIFGGSKTNSKFSLGYDSYNLYAVNSPPERDVFNMLFSVQSIGKFEGYSFETGGSYSFLNMTTNKNSLADHGLNAFLNIDGRWLDFMVGGGAEIDFHSLGGNSMSYIQITGNGKYYIDKLILDAEAGFQFANTTSDASLFNVMFKFNAKYMQSSDLTFLARISHSMENNNFQKYYNINPYISDSTYFDFNRLSEIALQANFHPEDNLLLALGAGFNYGTKTPYFVNSDTSQFILHYDNSTRFKIFSEGNWSITKNDILIYNTQISINRISNKTVPYDIPFQFSGYYKRLWIDELSSTIGATYIAERYANLENTISLPSYFDLFIKADYYLNKNFNIFIKVNNILNENIYIWNGYRERGMFFAAGLIYSF